MRELLAALRGTRGRVRVMVGAAAAVALAGGGVALYAMRDTAPVSCDDAGSEIASLAPELAPRLREAGTVDVSGPLAAFRDRYREVARAACTASRIERTWAPDLERRAQACLDLQRGIAERLVAGEVTRTTAPDLVIRVHGLPDPSPCGDAAVLASQAPLPVQLDEVIASRATLDAAIADASSTRAASLARAISEVERSPVHAEPLVAGRLDAVRGAAKQHAGDSRAAEQLLARAYYAARAIDDVEGMLRVVATLIGSAGSVRYDKDAAGNWLANGVADARRARERYPLHAAQVYLAAASIGDAEGEPAKAHEWLREVFALLGDRSASGTAHASMVRASVYITEGKAAEALADYERALALFEQLYGPEHLAFITAAASAAQGMLAMRRVPDARALMKRAVDFLTRSSGLPTHQMAIAKMNVAALHTFDKQPDQARRLLASAREILVQILGPDHPDVPKVDAMLAQVELEAGDYARAAELARRAIEVMDRVRAKPHEDRGQAQLALCDASRLLRDHETAIRACEASAEEYAAGDSRRKLSLWRAAQIANDVGQHERALAIVAVVRALPVTQDNLLSAQIALEHGHALAGLGREPATARRLLDEARMVFSLFGRSDWVAEVDKARAKLR